MLMLLDIVNMPLLPLLLLMMLLRDGAAANKPDPEAKVESKSANESTASDDVEDGRVAGNDRGRDTSTLNERMAGIWIGRKAVVPGNGRGQYRHDEWMLGRSSERTM